MLKQQENTFVLTPFVVAYEEALAPKAKAPKAQKAGAHLSKEDATREVLSRIVDRLKKI
jgi:hypothetical protein